MQKLISFTAELDEFNKFKFTQTSFPNCYAPDHTFESQKGTFSLQHSIFEGQTIYILYGLGKLTQRQLIKLKKDWRNYYNALKWFRLFFNGDNWVSRVSEWISIFIFENMTINQFYECAVYYNCLHVYPCNLWEMYSFSVENIFSCESIEKEQ